LLPYKFFMTKLFPVGNDNFLAKFFDDYFLPFSPAEFSYNFNGNRNAKTLFAQFGQLSNLTFILRAFSHRFLPAPLNCGAPHYLTGVILNLVQDLIYYVIKYVII